MSYNSPKTLTRKEAEELRRYCAREIYMDDESAAGPALEASLGWSTTVVDSWLGKNWDAIMKKVDQLNAWESGKKRIH